MGSRIDGTQLSSVHWLILREDVVVMESAEALKFMTLVHHGLDTTALANKVSPSHCTTYSTDIQACPSVRSEVQWHPFARRGQCPVPSPPTRQG